MSWIPERNEKDEENWPVTMRDDIEVLGDVIGQGRRIGNGLWRKERMHCPMCRPTFEELSTKSLQMLL